MMTILFDDNGLLGPSGLDYVESKAAAAFKRFGKLVRSVQFIVNHVEGSEDREDKECRLLVTLGKTDSVAVISVDRSTSVAISTAIGRVARTIERQLGHKKTVKRLILDERSSQSTFGSGLVATPQKEMT